MLARWASLAAQDCFRKARSEPLITLGYAQAGFRSVASASSANCGKHSRACLDADSKRDIHHTRLVVDCTLSSGRPRTKAHRS